MCKPFSPSLSICLIDFSQNDVDEEDSDQEVGSEAAEAVSEEVDIIFSIAHLRRLHIINPLDGLSIRAC